MKQITVVARQRPQAAIEVAHLLGKAEINLESVDVETIDDTTLVVIGVDHYDEALHLLQEEGWEAVTEDVLLIRLRDEPGAVARVGKRFLDADIQLRSLRILQRKEGWAIVAVSVDRTNRAMALLHDVLISEKAMSSMLEDGSSE
ncbi:MAG: hypothetical protein AAF191_17270 [Verrucomicrobiota bacterium]